MKTDDLARWIRDKLPDWRKLLDVSDGTDQVYEYLLGADCGYWMDQQIAAGLMQDAISNTGERYCSTFFCRGKIADDESPAQPACWICQVWHTGGDAPTDYEADTRYLAVRQACEAVASRDAGGKE